MQQNQDFSEEPVGIVISRGKDIVKAPSFRAYVYAVAPELERDSASKAA